MPPTPPPCFALQPARPRLMKKPCRDSQATGAAGLPAGPGTRLCARLRVRRRSPQTATPTHTRCKKTPLMRVVCLGCRRPWKPTRWVQLRARAAAHPPRREHVHHPQRRFRRRAARRVSWVPAPLPWPILVPLLPPQAAPAPLPGRQAPHRPNAAQPRACPRHLAPRDHIRVSTLSVSFLCQGDSLGGSPAPLLWLKLRPSQWRARRAAWSSRLPAVV